ncbi:MAG: ABC transporter ATP-binding protein [Chloroflexi bacterium]|nr:ABC transporter ATP-binding protein [Chloroflexota bacterium]
MSVPSTGELAPLVQIRELSTWFHTRSGVARAVDGVSFDIGSGRTVGLIGESGCGKSVTAMSITGLIDPPGRIEPGSSIRFDGRELVGAGEAKLRAIRGDEIGMVFQEPMSSLNPVYTVGTQIAEAVLAHQDVSRKMAMDRAVEMLGLVQITEPQRRVNDFPHELSGGMRQRVMIAIALACEPRLLIADEPTTALDVTIQAQIIALLAELRERLDMSMLLITHDLGVVSQIADHVVVMYAGRVVEQGATADILAHPQHPYTEALLSSIPGVATERGQPLPVIRGAVPSPYDWPVGCRFAPRCTYVFDRCVVEEPGLARVASGGLSACWLRHADAPTGSGTSRLP